jgi:hypothetical protein
MGKGLEDGRLVGPQLAGHGIRVFDLSNVRKDAGRVVGVAGNGFGQGWCKWFHFVRVGRENGFVW